MKGIMMALELIVLVSAVLLPWLTTGSTALPAWMQQGVGLEVPLLQRFAPQPIPDAMASLEAQSRLSALDVLRLDFISWRLWVIILLPLGAALLGLLALVLSLLRQDELAQLAYWATVIAAAIAAALMVIGMPLLMRLSLPRDMAANLLIAVFDLRLAWGFWVAWAATAGLAVVNALLAVTPRSARRPAPSYPPRVYR